MDEGELTNDEAALVFRRASELDEHSRRPAAAGAALTPAVIEQIAAEAGLSRTSVRQALAELRAGTLTSQQPVRRAALGPPIVVVERMVPLAADVAEAAVDRFLRRQLFRVLRHFGEKRVWEPRQGLGPSLTRSFDFNRRLVLTSASQVTSVVAAEPGGGACCVRFEAGLAGARRGYRTLVAGGAVAGAGATAAVVALTGDATALLAVPAGAGVAGGAYAAARAGYRSTAGRIEIALERFLDTLEHGPF